ncbi:GNAT family N-acetyltransferase [Marinomonas algicola]|uniref:GNAT family N-acetyltransferase n=1 Tax=Marinomonas algicola TaxID=2773454 RepID=UPI00174D89A1|nr:GNAT family N-acetyltransferase [Marinomonas algicola]
MFTYQTSRLSVIEMFGGSQETETLVSIMQLLTPQVVANLPPHFANIDSLSDAQGWYEKMVTESRLFSIKLVGENTVIGFVFVFEGNDANAHIGYLLGELYWGKGYATEVLKGLIGFIEHENKIQRLIAGVDRNNLLSSRLLHKLGFVESASENSETLFYEYSLSQYKSSSMT